MRIKEMTNPFFFFSFLLDAAVACILKNTIGRDGESLHIGF